MDILLEAFSLFAYNKPSNVKIHMHCGLVDVGWDIPLLAERFGISSRLIVTNKSPSLQTVSDSKLNIIYNAANIGCNTSFGEGHGLAQSEHAATGGVQIVPNHSAFTELYSDCGILVPTAIKQVNTETNTTGRLVTAEAYASYLQYAYDNPDLLEQLSEASIKKFNSPEYTWPYISSQWDKVFKKLV